MKTELKKRKDQLQVSISVFETLPECVASAGGEDKIVKFLNMYAQQKQAFPDAYDDLVEAIEKEAKFAPLTEEKTKTVDGKEVKFHVWTETLQEFIDRFREHANQHGAHSIDLQADPAAVTNWLQYVLRRRTHVLDLAVAVRERKSKVNEVFITGAKQIIANGSQDKWTQKLEKAKVVFDDFTVADDADGNVIRLAKALDAWNSLQLKQTFA